MRCSILLIFIQLIFSNLFGQKCFFDQFSKLNDIQKNVVLDNYLCYHKLNQNSLIKSGLCENFDSVEPLDFAWYFLQSQENFDSVYFLDFFRLLETALTRDNKYHYFDHLLDEKLFEKMKKNDSLFDSRLVVLVKAHKEINMTVPSRSIIRFWKHCEKKGWYEESFRQNLYYYWDEIPHFHSFQNLIKNNKMPEKVSIPDSKNTWSFLMGVVFGIILVILFSFVLNKVKIVR